MVIEAAGRFLVQRPTCLVVPEGERTSGPAALDRRLSGVESRLDGVESRLDGVEKRLDGVETRLVAVDTRLGMVEHDVAEMKIDQRELRREMNARFDHVDERFSWLQAETNRQFDRLYDRMTSHMRWSVSLVAVFGTLVTILIALGQMGP